MEILQRLILGTLEMPGYTQMIVSTCEDFDVYMRAKNKVDHSLLS